MGYERELSARQKALDLGKKRDAIEAEMDAILSSLTGPESPGLTGNLVDNEGFPRADIDVHHVRTLRQRYAVLSTDLKLIMAEIEKNLLIALAPPEGANGVDANPTSLPDLAPPAPPAPSNESGPTAAEPQPAAMEDRAPQGALLAEPRRPAFALVDIVTEGSPAASAGLEVNDRIVAFGAVSLRSFPTPQQALAALPGLLRQHENREVQVTVERGEGDTPAVFNLGLTPRRWLGQGLLGCHVVPLEVSQVDDRYQPEVATAVMSHGRPDGA